MKLVYLALTSRFVKLTFFEMRDIVSGKAEGKYFVKFSFFSFSNAFNGPSFALKLDYSFFLILFLCLINKIDFVDMKYCLVSVFLLFGGLLQQSENRFDRFV